MIKNTDVGRVACFSLHGRYDRNLFWQLITKNGCSMIIADGRMDVTGPAIYYSRANVRL